MIRLLPGDCRDVLATLPAESVQCVVCSPPYYGLRDYQTGTWDGGDATCSHQQNVSLRRDSPGGFQNSTSRGTQASTIAVARQYADTCGKCGAVRVDRQIGLEATPDEYLATMVAVFREVRRVLRRDGTCWVNIGDSYNNFRSQMGPGQAVHGRDELRSKPAPDSRKRGWGGLKEKDLLLMPARLALALQADGWWVRSDIIWHKPNPMPESVTDRPTSAHEHVFLLTKAPRYYFDSDAIRQEPSGSLNPIRSFGSCPDRQDNGRSYPLDGLKGAACRNVWTIATHAYPEAHFATFPPELAERCIKAGTSERGCCAACGKPWQRIIEKPTPPAEVRTRRRAPDDGMVHSGFNLDGVAMGSGQKLQNWLDANPAVTTGWSAGCQCNADVVPCTVLDPFAGAGTTLLVADRLQRDAIGIELNTAYTEMAMERCRADAPLLTDLGPMPEHPEESAMADLFAGDEYERPAPSPKPLQVPRGWDTGPGAHGTIHRTGRTITDMAAD